MKSTLPTINWNKNNSYHCWSNYYLLNKNPQNRGWHRLIYPKILKNKSFGDKSATFIYFIPLSVTMHVYCRITKLTTECLSRLHWDCYINIILVYSLCYLCKINKYSLKILNSKTHLIIRFQKRNYELTFPFHRWRNWGQKCGSILPKSFSESEAEAMKEGCLGKTLVVQWWGLHALTVEGLNLIPGQGTKIL